MSSSASIQGQIYRQKVQRTEMNSRLLKVKSVIQNIENNVPDQIMEVNRPIKYGASKLGDAIKGIKEVSTNIAEPMLEKREKAQDIAAIKNDLQDEVTRLNRDIANCDKMISQLESELEEALAEEREDNDD